MIVTREQVKIILHIIDTSKDALIDLYIPLVQQDIVDKTNNIFVNNISVISDMFSFVNSSNEINLNDNSIDLTDSFQNRMDIYITGSKYNNYHFEIDTAAAQKLTLNTLINVIDESEGESITIRYVIFPEPLKITAALMINHRIKKTDTNIKSEKIGRYSVTYRDNKSPADYPEEILSSLIQYRLGQYT